VDRCERFEDAPLIASELKRRNPKLNEERVKELLEKFRQRFKISDNGFFVRFVIAGLIEEELGEPHRGEYLFEVAQGRAI